MAVLKDLIVHGASRFLGDVFVNFVKAKDIVSDTGYFKKLTAIQGTIDDLTSTNLTTRNATVTALLDVQGDMHTNSWSNSNIATIDGSFYINPTSSSADGADVTSSSYTPTGIIKYNNGNYTQLAVTGTFNTSQLNLDTATNVAWPANSYVIITGDVLVDNEWYPLGTIRGKLESQLAANANSKTISVIPIGATVIAGEVGNTSLTDGHGMLPQTLEAIRTAAPTMVTASPSTFRMRKIKVSMTSYGGTYQSPIGIFMTAMGSNNKTFLDIYGGAKNTTTIPSGSGALAEPTLRIGNLSGMPAVENVTPAGWGIYTSNGFFTGTVVANHGKIAGWTIGKTDGNNSHQYITTHSNRTDYNASVYGMTMTVDGIGAYNSATQKFTLSSNGILAATGANIQGTITAKNFSALDNSGNIVAQLSDTLTIGQTTNNKFNIKITDTVNTEDISNRGPGVLLRKGTMVLNEINENGMKIYSAYTSSDTNLVQGDVIASFGVNATNHITECQIGSSQSRHFYINPDEFGFYSNNTSYGKIDFVLKQKDNVKEDGYYTWDNFSGSNYQYTIPINTYQDLSNSIQISGKIIYDVGDGSSTYTFSCTPNGQFVSYVDNEAFMLLAGVFGKSSSGGNPKPESNDVGVSITPNSGYQFTALEVNFTVTYSTYWQGPHYNFGKDVNSIGQYSFAMGDNTIAREDCQLVAGKFNNPTDDALFVIGNGTDSNNRSNLMVVGDNEIRVGNTNQSHLTLDYHSMQLIDKEGTTYFHVSDLRGQDGLVTLTETFHGDGKKKTFSVQHTVVEGVSAEVKNHPENTATREYNHYTFLTPPEDYHLITIVYKTNSTLVKAYTLGTRYSGTFLGAMSFVTGQGNSAEGFCAQAEGNYCHAYEDFSHAEGELTKARGKASHSEGDSTEANGQASHAQGEYTIAYNRAQTVIGTYNIDNSSLEHVSGTATHPNGDTDYGKYAFVIGNGTTWNAHSNALAIDWTGNIEIGIDTTASAGTVDGDLYAAIDALGWTSEVID